MLATARSACCTGSIFASAAPKSSRFSVRMERARQRCCAAVSGLLSPTSGTITFNGQDMRGADPRATVRAGLAHVIEGHRIFTQLSVTDNLFLAAYDLPRGERSARVEEALGLFPEIAAKRHDRGGALSGGQQQMLAVAQGLVRRPRLLMLDEPSAGLSPVLVDRVLSVAARLRETGAAVLLVEQLVEKALALADRSLCLGGRTRRARRLGIGTRLAASPRARLFWSRRPYRIRSLRPR